MSKFFSVVDRFRQPRFSSYLSPQFADGLKNISSQISFLFDDMLRHFSLLVFLHSQKNVYIISPQIFSRINQIKKLKIGALRNCSFIIQEQTIKGCLVVCRRINVIDEQKFSCVDIFSVFYVHKLRNPDLKKKSSEFLYYTHVNRLPRSFSSLDSPSLKTHTCDCNFFNSNTNKML